MARRLILRSLEAGLEAADPRKGLRRKLSCQGDVLVLGDERLDLSGFREVLVVGAGKASVGLAQALVDLLGPRVDRGLVVVPEVPSPPRSIGPIQVLTSTHPLPSERGQRAAEAMLDLASRPRADTLIFCLISGGGSALLPMPRAGIALSEVVATTEVLLASGASIADVNTVRKHLSEVKGGGLARRLHPAHLMTLIVSDVPGNVLDMVASGPTLPDPTTFADALAVLERHGLEDRIPRTVSRFLRDGLEGRAPETPKPGDACFRGSRHLLVVANEDFLEGARAALEAAESVPVSLASPLAGEASVAGRSMAVLLRRLAGPAGARMCAVLAGGETTVRVTASGEGGRNQEAALSAALALAGSHPAWLAFFGTDGIDGPTPAAGALADATTAERARRRGRDPEDDLRRHDSHAFFRSLGDLILTGPTGTNVGDVAIGLVASRPR